jgi:hypothetical protein
MFSDASIPGDPSIAVCIKGDAGAVPEAEQRVNPNLATKNKAKLS